MTKSRIGGDTLGLVDRIVGTFHKFPEFPEFPPLLEGPMMAADRQADKG